MDFIVIAAVSIIVQAGNPEANLDRIDHWTRQAAQAGADLVLFNETCVPGYLYRREIRDFGESLDGPAVKRLTAIAKDADIIICAGIAENDGGKCHNTMVLVGSEGLIGTHRKSSFPTGEEKWFDIGNDTNVFNIRNIPVGISICYESVAPATCKALSEKGAKIILAPYSNGVSRQEIVEGKREYFKLRAKENSAWYIACDQSGYDHNEKTKVNPGAACIVDPDGQIVALTPENATGEHMVAHRIGIARN